MKHSIQLSAILALVLLVATPITSKTANAQKKSIVAVKYGTVLQKAPKGFKRVRLHGRTFFRFQDTFYVRVKKGFKVIAPPIGTAVSHLSDDAEEVTFGDGKTFYYTQGHFYAFNKKKERYLAASMGPKAIKKLKQRRAIAMKKMSVRGVGRLGLNRSGMGRFGFYGRRSRRFARVNPGFGRGAMNARMTFRRYRRAHHVAPEDHQDENSGTSER